MLRPRKQLKCIIRPELCEAHLGKGRDVEWEESHHNQPHFVYLALSSDIKVGVTRDTQIPTRWIDQGASSAIIFAETPYRQLAGLIEVELKQFISDKTDWRKMLKNEIADINLLDQKSMLAELLSKSLVEYVSRDNQVHQLVYPVIEYPKKVRRFGSTKTGTSRNASLVLKGSISFLIREKR